LAGSVILFALKYQMEVGRFSPVVMLPSAQPLSITLHDGFHFVHPLCPTFPDALRLRFYPGYLHEIIGRERRASTFRINDKCMELGSSCLPAGLRSRISCVKRL